MVKRSGLPAFEDFLRARISMYQQVYFHKTSSACEAMFKHLGKILLNFKLPLDVETYIGYDDTSFYYLLRDSALFENEEQKSLVLNLLKNLLERRKFWKRVYEENIQKSVETKTRSLCPKVLSYLNEKGYRAESIENRTTLTNMRPDFSKNSNKLKVFTKKMDTSFSLEPIEAHSELVNRLDMDTVIRRVFVECKNQDEKENIKRMLYKDVIQTSSKKI
jgi:HD superfamily phosphohydrolase